jgi:hypothetical protein
MQPEAAFGEPAHGGATPLRDFLCAQCGYGARAKIAPERCPMCHGSTWELEIWRPFRNAYAIHRREQPRRY